MSAPSSPPASQADDNNPFFGFVDVNLDLDRELIGRAAPGATLADQDINSNEHAHRRRELFDLINRLQAIGLGAELQLPQIACIGSQSVGKSSLIESISGVALPRASGTCTRCPIECRLKCTDEDWTATVSLRFESGKSGYVGKTHETQFGPQMTDRMEVQERIRRAQLAILNPTIAPATFLDTDRNIEFPLSRSFSQNCVIVVLSGRDLSDLNFVDLPGLISNVADSRNIGDIDLVKELATSYISQPSCLILLTISCESDYENQGAGMLARKYDPKGLRTIGVLTKPDRIEPGSERPWISMIKNEANALRHGWFSVKQPSARDLEAGMSWSDARELDEKFFEEAAPWSTIEDEWRKQLGCSNLINHLGETLGKVILTRLPAICEEVDRLIALNGSQLEVIPPLPSLDPLAEVLQLISSFTRDVTIHVRGDPHSGRGGLVQSLVISAKAFQEDLRKITPVFRPTRKGSSAAVLYTPHFLPAGEDWPWSSEKGKTYWLDDVVELAEGARTRELPGEFPFAVTEELVTQTLKSWREPVQEVFVRAERIFVQRLTSLVEHHFGKHSHGGLRGIIQKTVLEQLEECKTKTLQELEFMLDMESLPFTLNSHYYLDYKEKFHKYYATSSINGSNLAQSLREEYTPAYTKSRMERAEDPVGTALDNLRKAGFDGLKRQDLVKLLPADYSHKAALEIMASVRAYYQVAYKRFADTVPLAIDRHYVRAFEHVIQTTLVTRLKISSPDAHDRCVAWMTEPQSVVRRRVELNDRKERLEAARMELLEVPGVMAMWDRLMRYKQELISQHDPSQLQESPKVSESGYYEAVKQDECRELPEQVYSLAPVVAEMPVKFEVAQEYNRREQAAPSPRPEHGLVAAYGVQPLITRGWGLH
ncbi:Myxovirus resistance protein [Ceratobasidium theobromae]|uniref:Myxovirus resistance protein n=1 Tax=Ceratobasidium theobromae TaxID=1582974 RepID=A0A5N5QCQ0_9AGAM|nr:Myxovirus resistance protein [Ceratobasidium theobromae]